MPNNNRGRRGAPAVNRGVAIGRAQTPVRARPVEDPILVVAQAITESQIVSNLHDTSTEHRNTIKQLRERIQDLTKTIKQKNREISNYRGLEQKVASLQNKIETMETPKIQKIPPTNKDIVDLCNTSIRSGKMMSEVFGETLTTMLFENCQDIVLEGTGLKDKASLLLFWQTLEKTGIVKSFETKDKTHHVLNITKPEEVDRLERIEKNFKLFVLDLHGVVPNDTEVMKDGKIISSGLLKYIKGLQEENKKLKQQIEQDDILFEDCQ